MAWQEPIYSNGVLYIPGVSSPADLEKTRNIAHDHARRLIARLENM